MSVRDRCSVFRLISGSTSTSKGLPVQICTEAKLARMDLITSAHLDMLHFHRLKEIQVRRACKKSFANVLKFREMVNLPQLGAHVLN